MSCIYKGNFDIFKGLVTNDHFRHFDTLIQTIMGLSIVFETIGGYVKNY